MARRARADLRVQLIRGGSPRRRRCPGSSRRPRRSGSRPPGAAARCRFDQSASGACGAQDCQPATTLRRLRPGPGQGEEHRLRGRHRAERERGHHAEVPAAAALAGPEQVSVLVRVGGGGEHRAVRRDDLQRLKVVAGQPVGPGGHPDAAAERQAGDADGRAGAARHRAALGREAVVEVDEPGARADRRGRAGYGDRLEVADVDDQPAACPTSRRSCARRSGPRTGRRTCGRTPGTSTRRARSSRRRSRPGAGRRTGGRTAAVRCRSWSRRDGPACPQVLGEGGPVGRGRAAPRRARMLTGATGRSTAALAIPGTATAAAPPAAMPRNARRFRELSVELVTSLRTPAPAVWLPNVVMTSKRPDREISGMS